MLIDNDLFRYMLPKILLNFNLNGREDERKK